MFKRNLLRNVSLVLTILFAALTILLAIALMISLLALATGDMGLLDTLGVFAITILFALLTAISWAAAETAQETRGDKAHERNGNAADKDR